MFIHDNVNDVCTHHGIANTYIDMDHIIHIQILIRYVYKFDHINTAVYDMF